MYFLAKVRFEVIQENGKIKKIREPHLVEADTIERAADLVTLKFQGGLSECFIESIQESKIMSIIR